MSDVLGPSARRLGAAVRAFFAWEPAAETKVALAALAADLRARPDGDAVRWVRPEGYHVTLRFLGNVAASAVPALADAAAEAVADEPGFEATLGAPHAFPSKRAPRVVVLDLAPEDAFARLAARLEAVATAAGLAPESRRFRPHLTLGRLRGRRFPTLDRAPPPAAACAVRELVLFRSDLARDGSHYAPLATLPLPKSQ